MTHEIYFAGEPSDGLGYYAVDDDGQPSEYYPTKKALREAIEAGTAWVPILTDEPYALEPAPAKIERAEPIRNNERRKQVKLFVGLDDLPGQLGLLGIE